MFLFHSHSRFGVDGEWTFDEDLPALKNDQGHYSNMLKVKIPGHQNETQVNRMPKKENLDRARRAKLKPYEYASLQRSLKQARSKSGSKLNKMSLKKSASSQSAAVRKSTSSLNKLGGAKEPDKRLISKSKSQGEIKQQEQEQLKEQLLMPQQLQRCPTGDETLLLSGADNVLSQSETMFDTSQFGGDDTIGDDASIISDEEVPDLEDAYFSVSSQPSLGEPLSKKPPLFLTEIDPATATGTFEDPDCFSNATDIGDDLLGDLVDSNGNSLGPDSPGYQNLAPPSLDEVFVGKLEISRSNSEVKISTTGASMERGIADGEALSSVPTADMSSVQAIKTGEETGSPVTSDNVMVVETSEALSEIASGELDEGENHPEVKTDVGATSADCIDSILEGDQQTASTVEPTSLETVDKDGDIEKGKTEMTSDSNAAQLPDVKLSNEAAASLNESKGVEKMKKSKDNEGFESTQVTTNNYQVSIEESSEAEGRVKVAEESMLTNKGRMPETLSEGVDQHSKASTGKVVGDEMGEYTSQNQTQSCLPSTEVTGTESNVLSTSTATSEFPVDIPTAQNVTKIQGITQETEELSTLQSSFEGGGVGPEPDITSPEVNEVEVQTARSIQMADDNTTVTVVVSDTAEGRGEENAVREVTSADVTEVVPVGTSIIDTKEKTEEPATMSTTTGGDVGEIEIMCPDSEVTSTDVDQAEVQSVASTQGMDKNTEESAALPKTTGESEEVETSVSCINPEVTLAEVKDVPDPVTSGEVKVTALTGSFAVAFEGFDVIGEQQPAAEVQLPIDTAVTAGEQLPLKAADNESQTLSKFSTPVGGAMVEKHVADIEAGIVSQAAVSEAAGPETAGPDTAVPCGQVGIDEVGTSKQGEEPDDEMQGRNEVVRIEVESRLPSTIIEHETSEKPQTEKSESKSEQDLSLIHI